MPFEFAYICRSKKFRKMKGIIILLFVFVYFPGILVAREPGVQIIQINNADTIMIWEKLDVKCDSKINNILKQNIEMGRKNGTTDGYRLQIFFGSGEKAHEKAIKVKTEFLSSNPNVMAYLLFKSPDFIVRIGNFRTKSEALKMQKTLLYQYPNSFIVADAITFPGLVSNTTIN
jgi:hypothetical protein